MGQSAENSAESLSPSEELRRLTALLKDIQDRISALAGPEVDAVLATDGAPLLLQKAQQHLQQMVRRQNELLAELRAGEERYRAIVEYAPDCTFVDREGKVVYVNEAGLKFFEAESADQLLGRPALSFFPPFSQTRLEERFAQLRNAPTALPPFHEQMITLSGQLRDVEVQATSYRVQRDIDIRVRCRDMTELRLAEETRHGSEALLRMATKLGRLGAWSYDVREEVLLWSAGVAEILEVPEDYRPPLEEALNFFAPDHLPRLRLLLERCLEYGESYDGEFEIITARGKRVWARVICEAVRDSKGQVVKLRGAFQDISSQKQATANLARSERRFRELAEHVKDVFYQYDPGQKKLLYISPSYERIWGRAADELYQDPSAFVKWIHLEDRGLLEEARRKQANGEPTDIEYRIVRPDGQVLWIHDQSFPVLNAEGGLEHIVGTARDLTERKHGDERIRIGPRGQEAVPANKAAPDLRRDAANRPRAQFGFSSEAVRPGNPAGYGS